MAYKYKQQSQLTRVLCTVAFVVFTFCYLLFYQADVMVVAQHIASGGQTHYVPWVGALLITLVLKLLQVGVNMIFALYRRTHALTYLPSMLVLAFITDISPNVHGHIELGAWPWVLSLVLVLFVLVALLARRYQPLEPDERLSGISSQLNWINLSTLFIMMVGVGMIGNGNRVFHYRAAMEHKMRSGDFAGALRVGAESDETDGSLTMLRAFSLSRERQLPERLFSYSLAPGSRNLVPDGKEVYALMLVPQSVIVKTARRNRHYQLCGLLMDKKLQSFAKALNLYYAPDSVLPTHYREAMALYAHTTNNPVRLCKDSAMMAEYRHFLAERSKVGDSPARQQQLKSHYGKTYWYYYHHDHSQTRK